MDFSDLEHFALKILLEREGETIRRTEAARELAAQFEEVMVDGIRTATISRNISCGLCPGRRMDPATGLWWGI